MLSPLSPRARRAVLGSCLALAVALAPACGDGGSGSPDAAPPDGGPADAPQAVECDPVAQADPEAFAELTEDQQYRIWRIRRAKFHAFQTGSHAGAHVLSFN